VEEKALSSSHGRSGCGAILLRPDKKTRAGTKYNELQGKFCTSGPSLSRYSISAPATLFFCCEKKWEFLFGRWLANLLQHQPDNIMAPSAPKRRKIRHGSDELGSADGESEFSDKETANQPTTRHKQPNGVDESALYSGGLYNSSLFKLQIDEMLAQVQPNYEKRMPGVDDALRRLKTMIEAIEDREMLPVRFWPALPLLSMLTVRFRLQMPRNRYKKYTRSLFPSRIPSPIRKLRTKCPTKDRRK
jgi:hypothetical protein